MVSCLVGCENASANIISNNIHTCVRTTITTITPITITTITTITTIANNTANLAGRRKRLLAHHRRPVGATRM